MSSQIYTSHFSPSLCHLVYNCCFFRFRFCSDWNWLIFDVRRRQEWERKRKRKKFRKHTRIKRFILILTTRNSFQFISSLCFAWLLIFYRHPGNEITNKQASKRTNGAFKLYVVKFCRLVCVILCSRSFHPFILRINKWIQLFIWKTRASERTSLLIPFRLSFFKSTSVAAAKHREWVKEIGRKKTCRHVFTIILTKNIYFRGFFAFFSPSPSPTLNHNNDINSNSRKKSPRQIFVYSFQNARWERNKYKSISRYKLIMIYDYDFILNI